MQTNIRMGGNQGVLHMQFVRPTGSVLTSARTRTANGSAGNWVHGKNFEPTTRPPSLESFLACKSQPPHAPQTRPVLRSPVTADYSTTTQLLTSPRMVARRFLLLAVDRRPIRPCRSARPARCRRRTRASARLPTARRTRPRS